MLLKDKIALVTAGASGMGRAGAAAFARAGAHVVVVDMNEQAAKDTVAGIEHSLLDLPTSDSLNVDTVFGPSYSRLTKTGLDEAGCRAVARWGGTVFFISNRA